MRVKNAFCSEHSPKQFIDQVVVVANAMFVDMIRETGGQNACPWNGETVNIYAELTYHFYIASPLQWAKRNDNTKLMRFIHHMTMRHCSVSSVSISISRSRIYYASRILALCWAHSFSPGVEVTFLMSSVSLELRRRWLRLAHYNELLKYNFVFKTNLLPKVRTCAGPCHMPNWFRCVCFIYGSQLIRRHVCRLMPNHQFFLFLSLRLHTYRKT